MELPEISGEVLTDGITLEHYSEDWSRFHVRPRMVAFPRDEGDVEKIIRFAHSHSLPVTPRGAGSNQSGSAVGEGIIVLVSHLDRILSQHGNTVKVQPGVVYNALDSEMRKIGMRLPYYPTSRGFCTIGGNIGTGAGGLHSVKYGTVDRSVRSLCFVNPVHGRVDTAGNLPPDLESGILRLQMRITGDERLRSTLAHRGSLKSSSGYNLNAFLRYTTPGEIVTHLLVGSVGTLGMVTEIELGLIPVPETTILMVLFFPSLTMAAGTVPYLKTLNPSVLEIMDHHGMSLLCKEMVMQCPPGVRAVIIVEFDENVGQAGDAVTRFAGRDDIRYLVVTDQTKQENILRIRESMLVRIKGDMETSELRFPAFADDLGVPPDRLGDFIADVENILTVTGTEAVIYGHAGEGNIHVRPMIRRQTWDRDIRYLADQLFRAAVHHGGTISGEHGAGRNRSKYLPVEWGDRAYKYFREIKELFDPQGIMNPGVMFTTDEVTKDLKF